MSTKYNFDNYDKDTLTKPRDLAWDNWAKFENESDKVQGYIRDVFYRAAEGEFKAQRGITLEQVDGKLINVAIKRLSFLLSKTDGLRLGDPLSIVLESIKAPARKGMKGTKVYGYYGKNLPENAGNKTVAELDSEDMKNQALAVDTEETEESIATDVAVKAANDDFSGFPTK